MVDLTAKSCATVEGGVSSLSEKDVAKLKAKLDPSWRIDEQKLSLARWFTFKGFAKAAFTANLAAYLSDREGHHADIAFGWGYCKITFTSHDLGGLSENDFICAAKLDLATR